MNKLFITAGTAALNFVTAAPASTSPAEARGRFFRRCFNILNLRKTARLTADPTVSVDSQLTNEKGWEPDKHQSPLYGLAASNPHVIAASLFSRKFR